MNDITENFGKTYQPIKAFVVYEQRSTEHNYYVESYDMDENGSPINAHPLTVREAAALARSLDTSEELQHNFLKPSGLLPKNVLYINPAQNGYAVWYTPAQRVQLYFVEGLQIPSGVVSIPPLVWKANKGTLHVYALHDDTEINLQTELYHAPFFNLYQDGRVCMGTVKIKIPANCLLDEFIAVWQKYFFESYFSHTLGNRSMVNGDIIQLWQGLVGTKKQFPIKSLIKNGYTLKHLLK